MANESELGIAKVPVRATLDELEGDLRKAKGKVEQAATGMKDVFKTILAGVGIGAGLFGLNQLTGAIGSAMEEAKIAGKIQADLNAVIKSTGGIAGVTADEVNELSSTLQDLTRFEDDAITQGQAMLLTFTNIGKDVFPQATEAMLNMAEKFGSIQQGSVQLGKALNDPVQGVTALRRVGVMLTDAQETQIKQFMRLNDVAGAQNIILTELETEFGGLARAIGETSAGKIDRFNNAIGNLKETLGSLILGPLAGAAASLAHLVKGVDEAIQRWREFREGEGEYTESLVDRDFPMERLARQLEILAQLKERYSQLGESVRGLSEDEEQAIRENTMMYDSLVPLQGVELELKMAEEERAYMMSRMRAEIVDLLDLLPEQARLLYEQQLAEYDSNQAIEEGNRLRKLGIVTWHDVGAAIRSTAAAQQELAAVKLPEWMQGPDDYSVAAQFSDQSAIELANYLIDADDKATEEKRKNAEKYWNEYEQRAKAAMAQVSNLINSSMKETEDWIRVALEGTSADVGDAWDEMARRAEAVANDVAATGTSPWLAMFDIPQDIIQQGGDTLKAYMEQIAADIRESPTVQELGSVGIDAMVANIKKELADQIGRAELDQTIALELASDPEAVSMMEQLGIDVGAAVSGLEDPIVSSIEGLKAATLDTAVTNLPDLLTTDTAQTLLGQIHEDLAGFVERTWDVIVNNFDDLSLSDLMRFAGGGMVPGPIGMPQLAIVEGGEVVVANGESYSSAQTINQYLTVNSRSEKSVIREFAIMRSLAGA